MKPAVAILSYVLNCVHRGVIYGTNGVLVAGWAFQGVWGLSAGWKLGAGC